MNRRVSRLKPKRKRVALRIAVVVADPSWREDVAALRLIRRAARLAAAEKNLSANKNTNGAVTILLADDRHVRALNREFRGIDRATNVLSFPAVKTPRGVAALGDIALAFGVVEKESSKQKKSFAAHAAHLAAHGVLHLLGYDHETGGDAALMEGLETRLLGRLGLDDPYGSPPYAKTGKPA